jgi:hypothetical protein
LRWVSAAGGLLALASCSALIGLEDVAPVDDAGADASSASDAATDTLAQNDAGFDAPLDGGRDATNDGYAGADVATDADAGPLSIVSGGLVFWLDSSYSDSFGGGAAQVWKNRWATPADGSAQAAYDFNLGATSSVEGSDPAFNGAAGAESASDFWTFSAGAFFSLVSGTNTTFLNSLHRAGAAYTVEFAVRVSNDLSSTYGVLSTRAFINTPSGTGWDCWFGSGNEVGIVVQDSAGNYPLLHTEPVVNNTIEVVSFAIDEPTSAGRAMVNGSPSSFQSKYTNPATSAALPIRIGSDATGGSSLTMGYRLYYVRLYNRALTSVEQTQNWSSVRAMFGM